MKHEQLEDYIDKFIEFYKNVKLNGWDLEYMRKLVIRNMQDIKRKYLKEKNKAEAERIAENLNKSNEGDVILWISE